MSRFLATFAVLLAFAATARPAAATEDPAWRELRATLGRLVDDAAESWSTRQDWPSTRATFASQARPDRKTLVRALTARWHELSAVDGLIKSNLLDLDPDFGSLPPPAIGAIVHAMPEIVSQPVVRIGAQTEDPLRRRPSGDIAYIFIGRQRAFISDVEPVSGGIGFNPTLSVLNEGFVLSIRDAVMSRYTNAGPEVRRRNDQLARARELTDRANRPTLSYRDQMIERLPRDRGMRYAALLADMEDRIRAGDASLEAVAERLVVEGAHLPTHPKRLRSQFVDQVRDLHQVRTRVGGELKHGRGKRIIAHHRTVRLGDDQRKRIIAALR
ncbi:MAG: hypothetical protein CMJ18_11430 [Phycisphaeraceae bacterium]|nr:hypothetical protein [Phycisphaeraceae bacterium]